MSFRDWLGRWRRMKTAVRNSRRRRADGSRRLCALQSLESRIVPAAPTLGALSNVTLLSGSPLLVALNGADSDNQPLSFTATSSNPAVTPIISTGNRSLRMDVQNFGTMVFQLFEDRVPRVTNHIITLAQSNFYDGSIFHRVINNFVIQGGDPLGNPPGTGGSSLGDFDDQFDVDLQHNRTGILSMAKTTDDTNDSQFFVTEGAQRHLDFNHSIFGLLTVGESVREAISNVTTGANNRPTTNVVLRNVDVITDTQNGVLMLKAPQGTSGQTTITVTVRDPNGNTAQRSFEVTITPDTTNSQPFLEEVPKLRTLVNTPLQFSVRGRDVEGNQFGFVGQSDLLARQLFVPVVANANLAYTVQIGTGVVDVTPSNGLSGAQSFTIATGEVFTSLDYQVLTVDILPSASPLVISGLDHPSIRQDNDSRADTFEVKRNGNNIEVRINGVLSSVALRSSVTTLTLNGSNDNDTFIVDYSGGDPLPSGGLFVNGVGQAANGSDLLRLVGGTASAVTHTPTGTASGTVTIDGRPVTYATVEAVTDQLPTATRTFQFDAAANQATLADDATAGNGLSRLTSPSSTSYTFSAPTGSLIVTGGAGNDTLTVAGLDSTFAIAPALNGNDGNDSLVGSAGRESLDGGAGNDVLTGGAGNDTIQGGAGSDQLREIADFNIVLSNTSLVWSKPGVATMTDSLAGVERAELIGGTSRNRIDASGFTAEVGTVTTLTGGGGADTIIGSNGPDMIVTFSSAADSISGLGGNDSIFSGNGHDTVAGGDGNDFILGQDGDDSLFGGLGDDSLMGSNGNDVLSGEAGADKLFGNDGHDRLLGGNHNDSLFGDAGDDSLDGGAGNDLLRGSFGQDDLEGGTGNDRIDEAGNTNFTLIGLQLSSTLLGTETARNVERYDLAGGAGANRIDASQATVLVILNGMAGNDTLAGGTANDLIFGGDGNDILNGGGGNDRLEGGAGNDGLSGYVGNDTLFGQNGQDTLFGHDGADSISGGELNDTLVGGGGTSVSGDLSDTLNGDAGTDTRATASGDTVTSVELQIAMSTFPSWVDQI